MTTLVGVVCESAADQRTGCALADRVLVDSPNGIQLERLNSRARFPDVWMTFAK